MGQAIRIVKKRIIEYSPMIKITYNELSEIIEHIEEIMYSIHKIPFVWPNFESDEGMELNKEPFKLLELGENQNILLDIPINFNEEDKTLNQYHEALNFIRNIKKELEDTPMENKEYIRIEFFN